MSEKESLEISKLQRLVAKCLRCGYGKYSLAKVVNFVYIWIKHVKADHNRLKCAWFAFSSVIQIYYRPLNSVLLDMSEITITHFAEYNKTRMSRV